MDTYPRPTTAHPLPGGSAVAVIGAGPVGLAAAAHLVRRGLNPLIFEAGADVGHSIREWGHVRMFSPWRYNTDAAAVELLTRSGWVHPDEDELPTGRELADAYLTPLAATPEIRAGLHFNARVAAVGREALDKVRTEGRDRASFVLHVDHREAGTALYHADAVIDASGTWHSPNPLGSGGIAAVGEREAVDRIRYGIPDVRGIERDRYAGRRVLVIGGGHSAANVLLDLARLQEVAPSTELVWAIRRADPRGTYGGEDDDALAARGRLGKRLHALVDCGDLDLVPSFHAMAVEQRDGSAVVIGYQDGGIRALEADEIVACTGARPDFTFLRELRLGVDPALESVSALAPLIDPNVHSCGTVRAHGERELRQPEQRFYIAGVKSYGRAPTFLLATGYEQVRSVVAALAGDREAADRVELVLPDTGVCSTDAADDGGEACCSAPAQAESGPAALVAMGAEETGGGCGCG